MFAFVEDESEEYSRRTLLLEALEADEEGEVGSAAEEDDVAEKSGENANGEGEEIPPPKPSP